MARLRIYADGYRHRRNVHAWSFRVHQRPHHRPHSEKEIGLGTGNGRVPIIEGRQVSKEYVGIDKRRTVALAGVDVVFYEGEITLLIGPSGCGKTTLLNIIAGFEKADSGSTLERGAPITAPHPSRGVIFQDPNLFPWLTVWENLMFGP